MDVETLVLLDRLAGGLRLYVENYRLSIGDGMKPSYEVDYKISDETLQKLDEMRDWYIIVGKTADMNTLPDFLQALIKQYEPRFLKQYPIYKDNDYFKGVRR